MFLASQPYYWVDGSVMQYTRWGAGEPNNYPAGSLQCGQMYLKLWPGHWNDHPCSDYYTRNYVCKAPKGLQFTCPVFGA